MGGVVNVVQVIMSPGFLNQQVSEAVFRAQIHILMKGHEEEFRLMKDLYRFTQVLLDQTNLGN